MSNPPHAAGPATSLSTAEASGLPAAAGVPAAASLEREAARLALAPDPTAIAQMANAFFSALPGRPVAGPGAALPSAPIFSAGPLGNAVPGTPPIELPLTPNNNPGIPALSLAGVGAARPSVNALVLDEANLSLPTNSKPEQNSAEAIRKEADLAQPDFSALPTTLESSLSFLPSALPLSIAHPLPHPRQGSLGTVADYYFLNYAAQETSHHPQKIRSGDLSTLDQPSKAAPFSASVHGLDLTSLGAQHRPELTPGLSAVRRPFEPHIFRRDFPILQQTVNGRPLVWLDNGATTQKPQTVIDRLSYFYENENSNIHRAAHTLAARSTDAYEAAREKVRHFINAPSSRDIIFVRGATEGINLVAQAWGRQNVGKDDEIVVTHLEHHANIVPWQQLAAERGARLRVAPVDSSGQILLDEYEKLLGPRTRIVAFTHVSNALGTVTPAQQMAAMAHRHGAKVLVDGAQSVSHMPIDVQALDADFFVFSGHKMFAPTGIGVVYGKASELETMPPWQGGGNMIADVTFERTIFQGVPERFEAGTGNIADAVGLGAAIDYLTNIGMTNIAAYEHELLAYMLEALSTVPGLKIIGSAQERAGAVSFVLDDCKSEDVGKALDREGIAVRSGHHCAQPILRRFGLESTVRPSLALYNTKEDIDALVCALLRIQSDKGRRMGRGMDH